MKRSFKQYLSHPAAFPILGGVALVLAVAVWIELHRLSRRQVELSSLALRRSEFFQETHLAQRSRDVLYQRLALLGTYEERIPYVDGYVWLGKFIQNAAPELEVGIDPPEIASHLIFVPDYCTGLFRIRGRGQIEHFLDLLRECETGLPFAHIEAVQFAYADGKKSKIDFSISLLLVMRLHDESPETAPAAGAIAAR